MLMVAGPIELGQRKPKMVFFVGPTGVGKTTTLVKLCARYSLKDKKKVNIVSFDTYRIGAPQ